MLTETQRQEYIREMEKLPRIVDAAIRDLTDGQLDTPYREGGWTVRQVVHHLADSHLNGYTRMKLILTEERPTLKPYDQDEWAKLTDAHTLPLDSSLSILRGLHERWVALLKSVPSESWSRRGFHPENGEMSLDDLLAVYGHHGTNHVSMIDNLRSRSGW